MADDLREAALYYHRVPRPGKLAIEATKPLVTQRDLSLAYSPGVAFACNTIVDDPSQASNLTARVILLALSRTVRPSSALAISAHWHPSQ
jgi:malate dehydrogenase (oxaloacetate-decarboxylating)(NADP+)